MQVWRGSPEGSRRTNQRKDYFGRISKVGISSTETGGIGMGWSEYLVKPRLCNFCCNFSGLFHLILN